MIMNKCHSLGCNNGAKNICSVCLKAVCDDHFHDGHSVLTPLLSLTYLSLVDSSKGLCNDCWKKESDHLIKLFWWIMAGFVIYLLIALLFIR